MEPGNRNASFIYNKSAPIESIKVAGPDVMETYRARGSVQGNRQTRVSNAYPCSQQGGLVRP